MFHIRINRNVTFQLWCSNSITTSRFRYWIVKDCWWSSATVPEKTKTSSISSETGLAKTQRKGSDKRTNCQKIAKNGEGGAAMTKTNIMVSTKLCFLFLSFWCESLYFLGKEGLLFIVKSVFREISCPIWNMSFR